MILLNFSGALASVNVRAFLRVIRAGESNQDDDGPRSGYRAMYHPTERRFWLGPLSGPHPRHAQPLPDGSGRVSTAFGAYQFTWSTVQDLLGRYDGLENEIKPWMQDCWCIALIHHEDALDDIISGHFDRALEKCRGRWASLPGSPLQDGGSKLAYVQARAVWERYGGNVPTTVATSTRDRSTPSAPIEDRSTTARPEDVTRIEAETRAPAAGTAPPLDDQESPAMSPIPFILPLLQSLFEAFSPVLRAKATKALDKQTGDPAVSGQVVDRLMDIVKTAAGGAAAPGAVPIAEPDPVIAVATVKSDAKLLAQVEAEIDGYLDQIAPMLDRLERLDQVAWAASEESMDRAAERSKGGNDDWMAKALVVGALIVCGFLILLVSAVAIIQIAMLDTRSPTTEVWAALTGIIGTTFGILGTVFAYRFSTTRQSAAKDFTNASLADMAARRR